MANRFLKQSRIPVNSLDDKRKRSKKSDNDLQIMQDNIDEANSLLNEIESKLARKKKPDSNDNVMKKRDEMDDNDIEEI